MAPQQIPLGFLWDDRGVVEVVEHQVHVLLNLRGQVGPVEVLLIFVDSDANAASRNVAGCARSLRQFFRIFEELRWRATRVRLLRRLVMVRWPRHRVSHTLVLLVKHVVASRGIGWHLALFPTACSCHREVVNDAGTVFAGGEDIAHACLIHIEAAQLRYFPFVLLALVKFEMLLSTFNVSLQCLTLLRLRWLRMCLKRDRLLQAVASHQDILVARHFLMNRFPCLWNWELAFAA